MRFKKILLPLVFVLCTAACFGVALAEDEVKVEVIAINPAELSEAGTVSVTFEISNHSDYELSSLSIAQESFLYEIAEDTIIPRFGSAKITVDVSIADSQISLPVIFRIGWTCGGEPYFVNKEITIARAVEPVISVTRTAAATHARQGDKLTLTYVLKNETKFDMSDIMLIDEQISNDPIRRNDTLRANDSFTIDYNYTMGTEDVVSAPVVTYVVNGKTKSFASIEPLTLSMVNIDVRLEITPGTPAATGVPFTIVARNIGNQKVTNILITDELGNAVNTTPFMLDVGGTQTLSYAVVPVMTEAVRNVSFALSGVDPFGESYAPAYTDVYPVYPFVDDSQIAVSVLGTVTAEWTAQTGTVGVKLQIQNNSSVPLTNAILSEESLGTLANYASLTGGQTVYESELIIGSPRNLNFTLTAFDPAGTERVVANHLLTVAYPETTEEAPLGTPLPEQLRGSSGIWGNAVSRVLIILGAIMLIAFAILMILTVLERSRAGGDFLLDEEDDDALDFALDEPPEELEDDDYPPEQSPDFLRRAQLFVPPQRRGDTARNVWAEEDVVPEFDDLLASDAPEEAHMPFGGGQTQRFTMPESAPVASGPQREGDPFARVATGSEPQWKTGWQPSAGEQTFGAPAGGANRTESGDALPWEPYAGYETEQTAASEPERRMPTPKVITVRQQAKIQPQKRNTIKRVTTVDEDKHE